MNVNRYVNKIVRKIKCSSDRKKEIKKELLAEIELRQEQGESLENIIAQMGSKKEIADSFNENISPKEKRKYVLKKALSIIAVIIVILLSACAILYRFLPKSAEIENSKYFDKKTVEDTVKETIVLLDDENYSALQEMSTEQMKTLLNKETMEKAKAQVAENWGKRQSFGTIYTAEMIQSKEHYAVAEIAVSYEQTTAVYHLTYDKDMKIAGLYVR